MPFYSTSDPGREKVVVPMINFKDANEILQPSAILVSVDEISSFFTRWVLHFYMHSHDSYIFSFPHKDFFFYF